jgi:hypothetical protein
MNVIAILSLFAAAVFANEAVSDKGHGRCKHCPTDLASFAAGRLRKNLGHASQGPDINVFQTVIADDALAYFVYPDQQGVCHATGWKPFLENVYGFFMQGFRADSTEILSSVPRADGTVLVQSLETTPFGLFRCHTLFRPLGKGSCKYELVKTYTIGVNCAVPADLQGIQL